MAAFGGLLMTNKGRNLQAKVQAGSALHYTRIGIGSGQLGGSSIADLTVLKTPVLSLNLDGLKVLTGGKASITGTLSNQDVMAGFYYRELGIFATDPDEGEILYCYGNSGNNAEYIPAGGGADVVQKRIEVIVITGNAANVTAEIADGVFIPATEKAQAGGVATLGGGGKVPVAQLPMGSLSQSGIAQLSSAVDSAAEDKAATPKAVKVAYDRGSEGVSASAIAQAAANDALLAANAALPAAAADRAPMVASEVGGTAQVIELTVPGWPTPVPRYAGVVLTPTADASNPTVSINGGEAVPVVGRLKAGKPVTMRYDGGSFFSEAAGLEVNGAQEIAGMALEPIAPGDVCVYGVQAAPTLSPPGTPSFSRGNLKLVYDETSAIYYLLVRDSSSLEVWRMIYGAWEKITLSATYVSNIIGIDMCVSNGVVYIAYITRGSSESDAWNMYVYKTQSGVFVSVGTVQLFNDSMMRPASIKLHVFSSGVVSALVTQKVISVSNSVYRYVYLRYFRVSGSILGELTLVDDYKRYPVEIIASEVIDDYLYIAFTWYQYYTNGTLSSYGERLGKIDSDGVGAQTTPISLITGDAGGGPGWILKNPDLDNEIMVITPRGPYSHYSTGMIRKKDTLAAIRSVTLPFRQSIYYANGIVHEGRLFLPPSLQSTSSVTQVRSWPVEHLFTDQEGMGDYPDIAGFVGFANDAPLVFRIFAASLNGRFFAALPTGLIEIFMHGISRAATRSMATTVISQGYAQESEHAEALLIRSGKGMLV